MPASINPLGALALIVSVAAASLVLTACKPNDTDGAAGAETAAESGAEAPGQPADKERVSYMIGADIGRSLKPMKDEIDPKIVNQAIEDILDDKKPRFTDEQMMETMQAFAVRMQEKQSAEMQAAAEQREAEGVKHLAEGKKFLAENGRKAGVQTTASGLQYMVMTPGDGPKPGASDTVKVHYRGTLLDGTQFDSSYDRGEPVTFSLDQVVPGWSEGLQLMPVGSKHTLWLPAELGYGETGTPGGPIPPNATLVFVVELLEIVRD